MRQRPRGADSALRNVLDIPATHAAKKAYLPGASKSLRKHKSKNQALTGAPDGHQA
jgi:hypothetical protein